MKINVTKPSMPSYEDYCQEIKSIWDSCWLTNSGPKHQELEKQLSKILETDNISLFTNGHLALEYILSIYNFPRGSEIITTPFTFVSTTNAIVRNGLTPLFCDVNEDDYTIDANKIERMITSKTVAILGVHVYGNICDVDKIEKIAKKHNVVVIYDAAHAFGIRYKNKSIATYGDASMFSFHATKVFNTIEGGCVCTKSQTDKEILDKMKNFGISSEDECAYIGGNAKMNEFQAAMGLCNLRHLDSNIKKRKDLVETYIKRLSGINGIKICKPQNNVEPNYAYFPVIFDGFKYGRDEVKKNLENNGIGSRKYFYPLTSDFDCYSNFNHGQTPVADYLSKHVLCLPLYPDLGVDEINQICDIIVK